MGHDDSPSKTPTAAFADSAIVCTVRRLRAEGNRACDARFVGSCKIADVAKPKFGSSFGRIEDGGRVCGSSNGVVRGVRIGKRGILCDDCAVEITLASVLGIGG